MWLSLRAIVKHWHTAQRVVTHRHDTNVIYNKCHNNGTGSGQRLIKCTPIKHSVTQRSVPHSLAQFCNTTCSFLFLHSGGNPLRVQSKYYSLGQNSLCVIMHVHLGCSAPQVGACGAGGEQPPHLTEHQSLSVSLFRLLTSSELHHWST